MDAQAGANITELLRDLNRGGQTVLVTHDRHGPRCATRVVEVRDGKLTEAVGVSAGVQPRWSRSREELPA